MKITVTNPRKISNTEALAFLLEKKIPAQCPACNHPRSDILLGEDDFLAITMLPYLESKDERGLSISTTTGRLVFACECPNCGLFRHFAHSTISAWAEKKEDNHE